MARYFFSFSFFHNDECIVVAFVKFSEEKDLSHELIR